MVKFPTALKKDPIVECVFEVRFMPVSPDVGDLLPGMLYEKLKGKFPSIGRMPSAQLPREIRIQDPALRYSATHAIRGDNKQVMVGERVFAVAFTKPYPGWRNVEPELLSSVEALQSAEVIKTVERVSLKYANIFALSSNPHDLSMLNLRLDVGGMSLRDEGKHVRVETVRGNCTLIVSIAGGAIGNFVEKGEQKSISGPLLDIDCIHAAPQTGRLENLPAILKELHDQEREVFFSLLTKETLEALEPIWESG